jgi:small-conductance mechanosensitive channel
MEYLQIPLGFKFWNTLGIYILLYLLGAGALYFIFSKLLKRFLKKFLKDDYEFTQRLTQKPILLFSVIMLPQMYFSLGLIETINLRFLDKILNLAMIFSITWLILRILKVSKLVFFHKLDELKEDEMESQKIKTQFEILDKILVVIVICGSSLLALTTFEAVKQIGISLFASAGVAGIILGFASQKLIASVISGVQLAITQPIRIDDVLLVENEYGTVEEINLTYVVLRTWDLRRLILPSTYFIENTFQNWTKGSPEILGTVFLYVDYGFPIQHLREEFMTLLAKSEHWDGKISAFDVSNASEKTVEVRALFSVKDPSISWKLRVYIREKLLKFIQMNYPESLPKTRIELKDCKEDRKGNG